MALDKKTNLKFINSQDPDVIPQTVLDEVFKEFDSLYKEEEDKEDKEAKTDKIIKKYLYELSFKLKEYLTAQIGNKKQPLSKEKCKKMLEELFDSPEVKPAFLGLLDEGDKIVLSNENKEILDLLVERVFSGEYLLDGGKDPSSYRYDSVAEKWLRNFSI